MAYTLTIDTDGADAIAFASYRYSWSHVLECLGYDTVGTHVIDESEAWELLEAFESDTRGGYHFFPLLAHDSKLAESLFALMDAIV